MTRFVLTRNWCYYSQYLKRNSYFNSNLSKTYIEYIIRSGCSCIKCISTFPYTEFFVPKWNINFHKFRCFSFITILFFTNRLNLRKLFSAFRQFRLLMIRFREQLIFIRVTITINFLQTVPHPFQPKCKLEVLLRNTCIYHTLYKYIQNA